MARAIGEGDRKLSLLNIGFVLAYNLIGGLFICVFIFNLLW